MSQSYCHEFGGLLLFGTQHTYKSTLASITNIVFKISVYVYQIPNV